MKEIVCHEVQSSARATPRRARLSGAARRSIAPCPEARRDDRRRVGRLRARPRPSAGRSTRDPRHARGDRHRPLLPLPSCSRSTATCLRRHALGTSWPALRGDAELLVPPPFHAAIRPRGLLTQSSSAHGTRSAALGARAHLRHRLAARESSSHARPRARLIYSHHVLKKFVELREPKPRSLYVAARRRRRGSRWGG